MDEMLVCPECGSSYLVRDGASGEVVCRNCGVVVSETEYVAPFTPEAARGSLAMTRLVAKPRFSEVVKFGSDGVRLARQIGRLNGSERTEAVIANMINGLACKLSLPKAVEEDAMVTAKKILKGMRKKRKRMTAVEISAVSLWNAIKVHGYPVTMKEYISLINVLITRRDGNGGFRTKSFYRLVAKASEIAPLAIKIFTPADYVGRLCAKLEGLADTAYLSAVEAYAVALCKTAEGELFGKDPVCTAATAICVADETLGGRIGIEKICKSAGAGYSSSTAKILKKRKPPLPPMLQEAVLKIMKRRALEALASERYRGGG